MRRRHIDDSYYRERGRRNGPPTPPHAYSNHESVKPAKIILSTPFCPSLHTALPHTGVLFFLGFVRPTFSRALALKAIFRWTGGRMVHSIPRRRTTSDWRSTQCTCWRTKRENLCPHLMGRWGR